MAPVVVNRLPNPQPRRRHRERARWDESPAPRSRAPRTSRAARSADLVTARPIRWIAALASLAITVVVGVEVAQDRSRVLEDALDDAVQTRNALVEHTKQTFAALDVALESIAEDIDPDAIASRDAYRELAARQAAIAPALTLFILDAGGRLVASSHADLPVAIDMSGSETFQHHTTNSKADLFISIPRVGEFGPTSGEWVITVSRAISGAGGEAAGVVAAAVSLSYLNDFYEAVRPGRQGAIGLIRIDGPILSGSPFSASYMGFDASTVPRFHALRAASPSGTFRADTVIDGVNRINAYARVPDLPLVVLVGVGTAERLAEWRTRAMNEVVIATLAIVLVWLLALFVRRRVQERQVEGNARIAQLTRLTEISTELMACKTVREALDKVARCARDLVPAHQSVASVTTKLSVSDAVRCVSLSDRYAAWRNFDAPIDGSGIYRILFKDRQPVRMTQAELESHPAWKGFGAHKDTHPPMRGWLAAPLVEKDGEVVGLIQLSDREHGEFTGEDEALLADLAQVTVTAIHRLQIDDARRTALEEAKRQRADAEHARSEAERARREIESIFSSITDAVYVLDSDWRFAYLNHQAEVLLERKASELVGRNVWAEFPEATRTVLHEAYHRARRDRVVVDLQFFYPPLDRWMHVRGFPHDQGLTVYFRDITDHVTREEQLRQAQKMDAIGSLTGGIAHDFNNLLTVILGNAQVLAKTLPADREQHGQATTIADAAERAAALTQRLLAFARRQPLDPKPTRVSELIGNLEPLLDRSVGEQYDMVMSLADNLPPAMIDPGQLETAILNLVINARDAMPDGGTVTIETAAKFIDEAYALDHGFAVTGCHVVIAVSDSGVGIAPEQRGRIFEPFYTTKQVGQGTGLGLPMVYGFIKQSNGHVAVYSEPGHGSTFRLYLPCADAVDGPDEEKPHAPGERGGSERILVVEDDDFVREFTEVTLQSLGYDIVATADGPTAIAILEQGERFDMLLSDVILAGPMNGREVAEVARAMVPGLRVLFMSGYPQNVIVHNGRLDPGARLLPKPFTRQDIAARIREILDEPE